MATDLEESAEARRTDRRRTPTSALNALIHGGRRIRNRRVSEHAQAYYVDRHPLGTFVVVMVLLALSLIDGFLTIQLLEEGAEEINPLMKYLIDKGLTPFLLGKFILTAAGIPLLLLFKNHYMFKTRFRVGYLLPTFVAMYLVLITYQLCLMAL